ncbi:hypothetical protein [Xanthomonas sp. XNM01]|uniref:hypothetical protein n=1 Tax=Xanthomonas sp. XNM01 TaxID=2769289 RepID=UPI001782BE90|nr:hypothetical protein [Xanthomonas sp. XNM01]MBD9368462.1 hypothetical protein [Xanthomonas sp. XNM01]
MWQGPGALMLALSLHLAPLHGWSLDLPGDDGATRVCLRHDGHQPRSWCVPALPHADPLRILAALGRAVPAMHLRR